MSTTEAQKRASKKYYEKNKKRINKIDVENNPRIKIPRELHDKLIKLAMEYKITISALIHLLINKID